MKHNTLAAHMLTKLDWIEVTETDRQYRRVCRDMRDALARACQSHDGAAIARQMAHIIDISALWGDMTFAERVR